jgi:hypothetical protein
MAQTSSPEQAQYQAELRSRNVRLGLILASVAAVFFIGFVTRLVLLKH